MASSSFPTLSKRYRATNSLPSFAPTTLAGTKGGGQEELSAIRRAAYMLGVVVIVVDRDQIWWIFSHKRALIRACRQFPVACIYIRQSTPGQARFTLMADTQTSTNCSATGSQTGPTEA